MSELRNWIERRLPPPPMDLDPWLESDETHDSVTSCVTGLGLAALDQARARPGRVRDSAFHLLAADALVTYACEAALNEDDPLGALSEIMHAAAGVR